MERQQSTTDRETTGLYLKSPRIEKQVNIRVRREDFTNWENLDQLRIKESSILDMVQLIMLTRFSNN